MINNSLRYILRLTKGVVFMTKKELLFKILDELEPNQIVGVSFTGQNYCSIHLCNKKSLMPVVTGLDRISPYENEYRDFYRPVPTSDYDDEANNRPPYINVELDGIEYRIIEEIRDIQFKEDYVIVTFWNPDGEQTYYHFYEDIITFRTYNKINDTPLIKLNKLNYLYKTNKQ